MPSELIVIWSLIGFGFVVIAGRWLGTDPHTVFGGLFAPHGVRDWPIGVQESDVPRFSVAHLDALRPEEATTVVTRPGDDEREPAAELVELGERQLRRSR